MNVGRHFGQVVLNRLVTGDQLAVLPALVGVSDRLVERVLRDTNPEHAHHCSRPLEQLHRLAQRLAALAKQVFLRHARAIEEHFGRTGRVQRHLPDRSRLIAVGLALDDQIRQLALAGQRHDDGDIRDVAVADPELLAAHDEAVSVLDSPSLRFRDVRARAGFGDAHAGDTLAA